VAGCWIPSPSFDKPGRGSRSQRSLALFTHEIPACQHLRVDILRLDTCRDRPRHSDDAGQIETPYQAGQTSADGSDYLKLPVDKRAALQVAPLIGAVA
jgi:hypothetical protein